MYTGSEIVSALIVSAGIATEGNLNGWGIWFGKMPTAPDTAVLLLERPGRAPNPRWLLDYPNVQVRVRGTRNDGYTTSLQLARRCFDVLVGVDSQNMPSLDLWLVGITAAGNPYLVEFDDNNCPVWAFDLRLIVEPDTNHDTNRSPIPGATMG